MTKLNLVHFYCRAFILLLNVFLPVSCIVEESILHTEQADLSASTTTRSIYETGGIPNDVFSYTDVRLTPVVTTLQAIDGEIHFMESFRKLYGTPLWNYAEIDGDEERICFYVPLFDPNTPLRINTIWFFYVENDRMSYTPIRRGDESMAGSGQEFLFDALSYTVFGEAGSSRIFKKQKKARSWVTVTSCFDVYTGTAATGLEYRYTECKDEHIWIDRVFNWQLAPDNGDGSGNDIVVGGGGGGSAPSAPNAKDIFTNDKLADNNWKIAEELLDLIREDCMGSTLFQQIKTVLGGDKIKLQFSKEEGSSYDPYSKVLSLGIELECNQLFHELWHVYQASQETSSSFQQSTMNQELEAHYAQYLYLSGKSWYSGSEYEKMYLDSSRGRAIRGFNKHITPKGTLIHQEDNDLLEVYIETIAIPAFRKEGYITEPYDATRSGKANFSNLNVLTKNCS